MAGLTVGLAVLFEAIEPDDVLPIGLPADDIARRAILNGAEEALEEGGPEALEGFIRNNLGDHADEVISKMDDLLGGCAFNSFKAGTLVMTDEGAVPIEEIREGSMVLAYDEATGEIGYYPVTDLISHVDIQVVYLTIAGETLVTTADHPFYTSGYEWMEAGDLQIGDDIRTAAWTTGTVEAMYIVTQPQRMYNFTVATAHTYFVGDGQWLVHNSGPFCGGLVKTGDIDPAADALARQLGGESGVKFANDSLNREFDVVSDMYIGQTTSRTSLGSAFRNQAKATFEAAQATGRKVYYQFQNTPDAALINKLYEYSDRYGVEVVIELID